MIALGMVCAVFAFADGRKLTTSEQRTYDAAQAKAGMDAEVQVKLALWCEARGWSAGRLKHLALAVLIEPDQTTARGLLGLVAYNGKWTTPENLGARLRADEALTAKLAAYKARRTKLDELAAGYCGGIIQLYEERGDARGVRRFQSERDRKLAPEHVRLAVWCEQNGLKAEAVAHLTTAVVLDPYRETTWRHLGFVKHNGRWITRAELATAQAKARAQSSADRRWSPLLRQWKGWLSDPLRRQEALEHLAAVTDVLAVASIERTFTGGNEDGQALAVRLCGQIGGPEATHALVELALGGRSEAVRKAAIQTLRDREPRDYAGVLVDLIHPKKRYSVRPLAGPGWSRALLVETPAFKVLRTYDAPPAFRLSSTFYGYVGYDGNGLPVLVRGLELSRMAREEPLAQASDLAVIEERTAELLAAAKLKEAVARQRLAADVNDIEGANAWAEFQNGRICALLVGALDAPDLHDDADAWHSWWYDMLGYKYEPPPQIESHQNAVPLPAAPYVMSCFVAGTPVRTVYGRRPIESLRVGDQVFCQDASTGAIRPEAIVVIHHNGPNKTLRITLDTGEVLVPSTYHRFWRAGQGWAQARALKTGDILRTYGGRARIERIEPAETVPVYNLDVAGGHTFFVGQADVLVHDNTLPDAHLVPFDAVPPLGALLLP